MINHRARPLFINHWFLVLAPFVVLVNAFVASSAPITGLVEFGVLFDLVILLPVLYFVSYRKRKSGAAIRAVGLACLGVWIATKLVPETDRELLIYIEPMRYLGLAVLVLLELAVIRLIFVSLSSGDTSAVATRKATEESEMPAWVAKLLTWEAGLWRRMYFSVKRLFRRDSDDV